MRRRLSGESRRSPQFILPRGLTSGNAEALVTYVDDMDNYYYGGVLMPLFYSSSFTVAAD